MFTQLSTTHLIALGSLGAAVLLTIASRVLLRQNNPLGVTTRGIRNVLIPAGALLLYLVVEREFPLESRAVRIVSTIFWVGTIWVVASLVKVVLFSRAAAHTWRGRVPGLFVDLVRFSVIAVGACLVVVLVWDGDITSAVATLGVGSIVLGLALQDTLGNLMAGIALLFERPFQVGDWIRVGDTTGEVIEINWRAVHLRLRSQDLVVVPNSALGKERIQNFSRPTPAHAVNVYVRFAFNDPPNTVKRILAACARQTADILPDGIVVRTHDFAESAVSYEIRCFTERFERLPDIEEEIRTRIWYAARRNGLTIPLPTRTIMKTEVPPPVARNVREAALGMLRHVPLFAALAPTEIEQLADAAVIQEYAAGEEIVSTGQIEDALFIINTGHAEVRVHNAPAPLARLGAGDFFGEMALLTGEPRAADVAAVEDCEVLVIYKEALQPILLARPQVTAELARLIEARQLGLAAASDAAAHTDSPAVPGAERAETMVQRIRRFFGLPELVGQDAGKPRPH